MPGIWSTAARTSSSAGLTPAGRDVYESSTGLPSCVRRTVTTLFPAPIRFSLICSLVPLMVDTMVMMEAMPMMMPSMVRKERSLWLQSPWKDSAMF